MSEILFAHDPCIALPSDAMIDRVSMKFKISKDAAQLMLLRARADSIRKSTDDPWSWGYEPPIWFVAKALLRGSHVTENEKKIVYAHTGLEWDVFAERMRLKLGFDHPVSELLIMGANRSGKTDFAAVQGNRNSLANDGSLTFVGAQQAATSKILQQPRIYWYLPKELKRIVKTPEEYIAYSHQNGFSSGKITFRNKSQIQFISYKQDSDSILEGPAVNQIWLDEEFTVQFLEASRMRIASCAGSILATFTPIKGYTPVVADYLDNAIITRYNVAYMLPIDNKDPEPWNTLGLTETAWDEILYFRNTSPTEKEEEKNKKKVPLKLTTPYSVPENCFNWLDDNTDCDPMPTDRRFERVPRCAISKGGEAAILWFHGRDNPYGRPYEVIMTALKNVNSRDAINKRVYGLAKKIKGRLFVKFDRLKHVIKPEDVPEGGLCCMSIDPAPERNWFILWCKKVDGIIYVYREFPGADEIPEHGFLGEWATVSDKRNGINDGKPGDGAQSIGLSILQYKAIIAMVEGWKDWEVSGLSKTQWPDDDSIKEWNEKNGAKEYIYSRVGDPRALAQSKIALEADVTLLDLCLEISGKFIPASGGRIQDGLDVIIDLLAHNKIKFSSNCHNLIFAFENFTGTDGQKGACKDPLDALRYILNSGILNDEERKDDEWKKTDQGFYEEVPQSRSRPGPGGSTVYY